MAITLEPGEQRQLNVALTPTPVPNATLFGYVTDAETSQLIPGALVQLSGGYIPVILYSATTNSQGYYQILNIVPGVYTGMVSAAGYNPYSF